MRKQMTCTCKGYRFPHRATSGKCLDDGSEAFCGECNEPCRVVTEDFGIGSHEYWGFKGVHRDVREVSHCCNATVYQDASLKHELVE